AASDVYKRQVVDESIVLEEGDIYVYRTDVYCNGAHVDDFPVLIFKLKSIIQGTESNVAEFTGFFQVDDSADEVELDRSVDVSSWSLNITAPNSIQDVTIGINSSATDKLDPTDTWTLPPYPTDKVFLLLDKCYSKNIKPGDNGASWEFVVIVPDGDTTSLTWDTDAVDGVNVH
ncbi:S-layer protein domain-containing protein, partial [Methanosarcina sp. 2.H.T.1A.3]|uniref:S-layer protein domain-containing protein n=1 Tax=Methanosarcina sp. 2.H.T.1A.3 TaxID=1483597 RepID=UPI00064ED072